MKTQNGNLNYLINRKVRVIGNALSSNGMNVGTSIGIAQPFSTIGSIVTVKNISHGNPNYIYIKENMNIYFLEKDIDTSYTKEMIEEEISNFEKEIVKFEKEISSLRDKQKFMDDNGLTEYDEDQFKVYKTLSVLEQKETSQMEKAKIIADLIRG